MFRLAGRIGAPRIHSRTLWPGAVVGVICSRTLACRALEPQAARERALIPHLVCAQRADFMVPASF